MKPCVEDRKDHVTINWIIVTKEFHHLNSGQNQNIRVANESFEKVAKFKYVGTKLTNQNDIHDELKSGMFAIFQARIICLIVSYQNT
jgi:hypothetical protein